jgi:adenosine deaminase
MKLALVGAEGEALMKDFVRRIPKAELHLHIEGTLEPEMMFALAERNGIELPYPSVEEVRRAYEFENLQSFLDIYYAGAAVLRTETDFYDLASTYLQRAAAENVRRAEIFFDPQTHLARGIPFATVINGLHGATVDRRRELNISSALILCFLRDLTSTDAMDTLEQALPFRDKIIGIGLDSAEISNPPGKFVEVFRRARDAGLLPVAHAGEEGSADYIREALDQLGALRIDHGVHCLEDADLTRRLAEEQIPLTVCPLSNVKLGVFPSLEAHNIRLLMEKGLCVTINSDDPAYFGGYVSDNLAAVQSAFELNQQEIFRLARNSFRASFLEEDEKDVYYAELDAFMAAQV